MINVFSSATLFRIAFKFGRRCNMLEPPIDRLPTVKQDFINHPSGETGCLYEAVLAACKLPLALAHVLSIAARAHAKSLHALWPIRAPTFRLRQSERHSPAAPIRTRELSSRLTGQRRIIRHFGASRLHTHASRNIT